jgi:hypothetical protein
VVSLQILDRAKQGTASGGENKYRDQVSSETIQAVGEGEKEISTRLLPTAPREKTKSRQRKTRGKESTNDMTELSPLNSQRYFCKCGIGPADNCPAPHVTEELKRPGSPARHYAALITLAAVIVLAYQIWNMTNR